MNLGQPWSASTSDSCPTAAAATAATINITAAAAAAVRRTLQDEEGVPKESRVGIFTFGVENTDVFFVFVLFALLVLAVVFVSPPEISCHSCCAPSAEKKTGTLQTVDFTSVTVAMVVSDYSS